MVLPGLWTDAWFYISALGLLVSAVLFFVLLGQYRAAVAANDTAATDDETRAPDTDPEATTPVQPVLADASARAAAPLASVSEELSPEDTQSITPRADPPPPPLPPEFKPASASAEDVPQASPSPAAAYLRGLKSQLDELHEEVRGLSRRLDAADDRDEKVLSRLADIAGVLTRMQPPGSAPALPAPSRERETVKALTHEFDENMRNGLREAVDGHFSEVAAAVADSPAPMKPPTEPPADESSETKPRRAPVWPV